MPFSKQQISDIKDIIISTINDTLSRNEELIQTIARAVVNEIKCDMEVQHKKLETDLKTLVKNNDVLKRKVDILEQQQKKRNIRIFGLKIERAENLNKMVINMLNDKYKHFNICENDVENVFQYKGANNKTSIVIAFNSYQKKRIIMQNKKKLKGTGIFIMDDLTVSNLKLFKKVQEKYGKKKTWTSDGIIYYFDGNVKQKVVNSDQMNVPDEVISD